MVARRIIKLGEEGCIYWKIGPLGGAPKMRNFSGICQCFAEPKSTAINVEIFPTRQILSKIWFCAKICGTKKVCSSFARLTNMLLRLVPQKTTTALSRQTNHNLWRKFGTFHQQAKKCPKRKFALATVYLLTHKSCPFPSVLYLDKFVHIKTL